MQPSDLRATNRDLRRVGRSVAQLIERAVFLGMRQYHKELTAALKSAPDEDEMGTISAESAPEVVELDLPKFVDETDLSPVAMFCMVATASFLGAAAAIAGYVFWATL